MTPEQDAKIRRFVEEDNGSLSYDLAEVLWRELDETRDMLASCRKERSELQAKVWGKR